MAAQKGSLVLFKVSDGGSPAQFLTLGGMRLNRFEVNNRAVDAATRESGRWRRLLGGAGNSQVTLEGSGVFLDTSAEKLVRIQAFHHAIRAYRMTFGNGDVLEAEFAVTRYARSGEVEGEEEYDLSLESAGPVVFTPAA